MTDQPSNYAADVECAIGLNVGDGGTEGVHAARDAVLAVRDQEIERLKLLVAASSEPGHAVRMAAQYADRAIENGKRAEQAEELLRIAHDTSNASEAARQAAEERAEQAEAVLRGGAPVIQRALDCLDTTCRYHGDRLDPDEYGRRVRSEACCDTGIEPRRAREAKAALGRVRAVLDGQQPAT
ncbi:hypothetical protein PXH67_06395 [Streptomyces sp. P8-A8]|uniref:hypothetical protein n=1 Tax=Streptomyces sp. P8-A8 TaxID=3029759 RepID=UPI0036DF809E